MAERRICVLYFRVSFAYGIPVMDKQRENGALLIAASIIAPSGSGENPLPGLRKWFPP